ncbi:MAG: MlaD family protein [Bacteroidota bacterium]
MKISREVKTGVIALTIIVLFVWSYSFLKDRSFTDSTRTFFAEYSNVQGLIPTSPVLINGLKVGKIADITFHPTKTGILIAHIELEDDIEFSKNSIAQIFSPDFISGKSLKIVMALDGAEIARKGDTIIGKTDVGILGMINEQIAPLQSKVESFIVNSDTVMSNINKVLDAKNKQNLDKSLENLSITLEKFKDISYKADRILDKNNTKIDSIFNNANTAMNSFSQISDSLQKANLAATVIKLQTTLESFNKILDSIDNGQGTLGKLVKDDALYKNLEGSTKELEELLREMKENPKRFVHFSVFGKKETTYQKEEKK